MYSRTRPRSRASASAIAVSASRLAQNGPCSWFVSNSTGAPTASFRNFACTVQKSCGTKFSISRSRSTISDEREGLDPNQLALPVEVRCDHDFVRLSREGLQGGPDLPRGHDLLWFGPDELLEIHAGPVVQGIRIIEVDDVAAEADHLDAVFALGELENGRALHVRPLRFSSAEDRRDPYSAVELLRHDEP